MKRLLFFALIFILPNILFSKDYSPFVLKKLGYTIYEGVFTGNGLLGSMVYLKSENSIRIDVGRTDVYDNREDTTLSHLFSKARLPIGHFEIRYKIGKIENHSGEMNLNDANSKVEITVGGIKQSIIATTLANQNVILIELDKTSNRDDYFIKFIPSLSKSPRSLATYVSQPDNYIANPIAEIGYRDGVHYSNQRLISGGGYKTAFANRDPRLDANVVLPYSTFLGNNNGVDQILTSRWPYRAEFGGVFDLRTDITARFYYYPRKFVYTGANPGIPDRSNGAYDYIVMCYADILLLWAEALNESNKSAEALAKINEVRTRAEVANIASSISQGILRSEIQDERRRELMGEGVIYFDELRWGTLKDRVFYTGNGIKEVWGAVTSPYTWGGDQLYIWPIPQVERERNTSLIQNPGWYN